MSQDCHAKKRKEKKKNEKMKKVVVVTFVFVDDDDNDDDDLFLHFLMSENKTEKVKKNVWFMENV